MLKLNNPTCNLLDVVAVIEPSEKIRQGAVGTIVEELDKKTFLVEFSDDDGQTIAMEPFSKNRLLKLIYDHPLVVA